MASSGRSARHVVAAAAALCALLPGVSGAQDRSAVSGRVVKPGGDSVVSVTGAWVTLHRVGSDRAEPLDSVRADGRGRYRFDFERTGDERAIYFVSASWGGIAYFTPPLMHSTVRGEEAEIAVFDTTSAAVPIGIRGHHIIVSAVAPDAMRTVTEVFELSNDSSVTRVSRAGTGGEVWSAILPRGARAFRVSQGDVPAAAVTFEGGRALVYAPLAPGLKQLAYSYSLPASSFPLRVPLAGPTQIFEVLLEDERGTATGANLEEKAPVALERRSFRRFLGDDVPANAVAVIDLPSAVRRTAVNSSYMVALTIAIGSAMVFALARALRRR